MIHNNMIKPPKCANPQCENDAMIGLGDDFYCVNCVMKFKQAQQKYIQGVIQNADNNMPKLSENNSSS